jgi:hypothetical protein
MNNLGLLAVAGSLFIGAFAPTALTQTTAPASSSEETTVSGVVASSSKNTLVVRTANNSHQLFVYDRDTIKPAAGTLKEGTEVTVTSVPTDELGLRLARSVVIGGAGNTEKARQTGEPTEQADQPKAARPSEPHAAPLPASARRVQEEIEREARRFGMGFRTGVGLDPEVMLVGAHARFGPIFSRDLTFRPNVEFGFGEVTKLFAVNLDAAYRLGLTPRWSKWSIYAGGGPSLGFTHQNFERGESDIDFGDFDYVGGLNIFTGIESRRGFFIETRATLWASPNPNFRLLFGWTF